MKTLPFIFLTLLAMSCNRSQPTKDDKIYLTYLYYQKLADKEAGCPDKADTSCLEKFNKIWPIYSDSIRSQFKIDGQYLDKVIMNAIEKQAASKDWSLNQLSEDELKNVLDR